MFLVSRLGNLSFGKERYVPRIFPVSSETCSGRTVLQSEVINSSGTLERKELTIDEQYSSDLNVHFFFVLNLICSIQATELS